MNQYNVIIKNYHLDLFDCITISAPNLCTASVIALQYLDNFTDPDN